MENISSECRRFDSVPGDKISPEKSYIFCPFFYYISHLQISQLSSFFFCSPSSFFFLQSPCLNTPCSHVFYSAKHLSQVHAE
ncbi:hypothetical protein GGI43DRAFT_398197 [Trichoderma evansii]